jgi:hypothetical protein
MLKRLREWGVKRFYGYPGDGINAVTSSIVANSTRSLPPPVSRARNLSSGHFVDGK